MMSGVWLGYKISFYKNKQTKNSAQQGSEYGNIMNERKWNQAQVKKKTATLADLNLFYTAGSIPCTNVCVHITPFACTLHTYLSMCTEFMNA